MEKTRLLNLLNELKKKDSVVQHMMNVESRITVSISPQSSNEEFRLVGMPRTYTEIVALIYFLPYIPRAFSTLVQVQLEDEIKRRNRPLEQRIAITSFLGNRTSLLVFLEEQNARWLFGHFQEDIVRTILRLKYIRRRQQTAKRQERIRGYRDHGTLLPESEWKERFDESFTIEQNKIESEDLVSEILSFSEAQHYLSRNSENSDIESPEPQSTEEDVTEQPQKVTTPFDAIAALRRQVQDL